MKKILLLIPLQLSLIFPNLLMTQINYDYSKNNFSCTKNSESYITDTSEKQVMFNFEQEKVDNKSSYGYYTNNDLIWDSKENNSRGKANIWSPSDDKNVNIEYEVKIGITNKTSTYYTNNSYNKRNFYNIDNFEDDNFKREIKTLKNYYGIGVEIKITNPMNNYVDDYLNTHSLYIGQTYNDASGEINEIGNYQKVEKREVYNENVENVEYSYDNWSGMIEDKTYLNFKIVDNNKPNHEISDSKQIEITADQIYNNTNLNKNEVNTYNNSFGINYDDITYKVENDIYNNNNIYSANFDLKWNSPYYFWSQYFHYPELKWINKEMYFSSIYKISVQAKNGQSSPPLDVVLLSTNNIDVFSPKKWTNNSNIKTADRSININYDLYNQSYNNTYLLGCYDDDDNFHPRTNESSSALFTLDQDKINSYEIINNEDNPKEMHFFLSFEYQYSSYKWENIFDYNEFASNQAIAYKLVDENNNNIFQYDEDIKNGTYYKSYNDSTGYQNAFLIPEWDNVYHDAPKGSFYYMNFIWFILSIFISFIILIIITNSFYLKNSNTKKKKKEVNNHEQTSREKNVIRL